MPSFPIPDPDDDTQMHKLAQDEVRAANNLPPVPPPPIRAANNPPINSTMSVPPGPIPVGVAGGMGFGGPGGMSYGYGSTMQNQMNPAVGLAQAEIDSKIVDNQLKKQDEHWAKAYWRPAMGWLYMAMCAFDFIIFPLITLFLPIIEAGSGVTMPYNEWKSLTLSNGGLIHLAFGAILGVAAYTRGQEKIAGRA